MSRAESARTYRFGSCELRPAACDLLRGGRPVAIAPKPFALIAYLIRHRDRVVSREELLEKLWRGVHVQPQSLGFVLHAARKAVGDDGERQQVIRTVPRTGLAFVAEVEEIFEEPTRSGHGVTAVRATGACAESLFVGRGCVLAEGRALLEAASGGAGRVLLVSGEPGIGKTRALERLAELAAERSFLVLHGRCVETEGAPSLWPWVQILRAAVATRPQPDLLRRFAQGASDLAWLVPELGPHEVSTPRIAQGDARTARFLLFESVAAFLGGLAGEAPLWLDIDDLHRADPASLALLRHVAAELRNRPVVLAAAYREGELRATPQLADGVVSVAELPHCRNERLHGLERCDVARLVHALSGHEPSPSVAEELLEKTDGNPLFLRQIVSVLAQDGRLPELEEVGPVDIELPEHVQEAIRRQLQPLPEATREVIELAAVSGREFAVAELAAVLDVDPRALLARMTPALRAGVIREHPLRPGAYQFVHVLMRDAAYAGIEGGRRADLHVRLGKAIESVGPGPQRRAAELAHHFIRGGCSEGVGRAMHYSRVAARWSLERGAIEDAPVHLRTALELLERSAAVDEKLEYELLVEYADALTQSGQREAARDVILNAARMARRGEDAEGLARAALRYAPDFLAIEQATVDQELVQLLEEALGRLDHRPSAIRARVKARLAVALHRSDTSQQRIRELGESARSDVRATSDEAASAFVDVATRFAVYRVDHPEERLSVSTRLLEGEESTHLLERTLRATALMQLGRSEELGSEIERFGAIARQTRQPQAFWFHLLLRSTEALRRGDYREWDRCAGEYLRIGNDMQDRNAAQSFHVQKTLMAVDCGGLEACVAPISTMVGAFPEVRAWRSALAYVCTELGRTEEARRHLDDAIGAGVLDLAHRVDWFGSTGSLALMARELGWAWLGEEVYRRLLPFEDQFAVIGHGSFVWGSLQRFLANAALAMGRCDEALHRFRTAIRRDEASGGVPASARAYLDLARTLGELGEPGREEALRKALAIARSKGMDRLEGRVRAAWPSA